MYSSGRLETNRYQEVVAMFRYLYPATNPSRLIQSSLACSRLGPNIIFSLRRDQPSLNRMLLERGIVKNFITYLYLVRAVKFLENLVGSSVQSRTSLQPVLQSISYCSALPFLLSPPTITTNNCNCKFSLSKCSR